MPVVSEGDFRAKFSNAPMPVALLALMVDDTVKGHASLDSVDVTGHGLLDILRPVFVNDAAKMFLRIKNNTVSVRVVPRGVQK